MPGDMADTMSTTEVTDAGSTALSSTASVDQRTAQAAQPAQATQSATTPSVPPSPDDPAYYRFLAEQQAQAIQYLQAQLEELALAQTAGQLRAQGANDQQVNEAIQLLRTQQAVQRERMSVEAQRAALQPVAKQVVAQKLAQQYSTDGLTIQPDDLMDAPTPEAMEARARTMNEMHRRYDLQQRAKQGTDKTPGESDGGASDDTWWLEGSSRSVWARAFARRRQQR